MISDQICTHCQLCFANSDNRCDHDDDGGEYDDDGGDDDDEVDDDDET